MTYKAIQLRNYCAIFKDNGEIAGDREISKRNKFECIEAATKWCDELNEYNARITK
jgi:hypothetical protein